MTAFPYIFAGWAVAIAIAAWLAQDIVTNILVTM